MCIIVNIVFKKMNYIFNEAKKLVIIYCFLLIERNMRIFLLDNINVSSFIYQK